jgi:hypothetical protein
MSSRVFPYLIVGAAVSVLLGVAAVATYQPGSRYSFITGYQPIDELYLSIGWYGSGDENRHVALSEFQALARKGDRVEYRYHQFEYRDMHQLFLEASLWRQETRLASWCEFGVPFFLALLLAVLSPTMLAGLTATLAVIATRRSEPPPRRRLYPVVFFVEMAAVLGLVVWVDGFMRQSDAKTVSQAVGHLKVIDWAGQGLWSKDVAELYRRGQALREVGEADYAPITPLVDKPRPYHGYYFVAMEKGPDDYPWAFAFCAFPADPGVVGDVWLIYPGGHFRRKMQGGTPILRWPSQEELMKYWSRVC